MLARGSDNTHLNAVEETGAVSGSDVPKFVLSFAALTGLFYLLQESLPQSVVFYAIDMVCRASAAIGSVLGLSCAWKNGYVRISGFTLQIVRECIALPFLFIYIAGVLSYPRYTVRYKAAGLFLGIVFLITANIVRIVVLGVIGAHVSRPYFNAFHQYIWHFIYVSLVFLAWWAWMRRELFSMSVCRSATFGLLISAGAFLIIYLVRDYYERTLVVIASTLFAFVDPPLHISSHMGALVFYQYTDRVTVIDIQSQIMNTALYFVVAFVCLFRRAAHLTGRLVFGTVLLFVLQIVFIVTYGSFVASGMTNDKVWVFVTDAGYFLSQLMPLLLSLFLTIGLKKRSIKEKGADNEVMVLA